MNSQPLSPSGSSLSSRLRQSWRAARWLAVAAGVFAVWACNSQPLQRPDPDVVAIQHQVFQQAVNRQLDLIFMVDNSSSMTPLQTQMTRNLPDFMNVLKDPATGGLPDVHIGVVSSDLGAGRSIVPGCMRIGGDQGQFLAVGKNPVGCNPPENGAKYIIDSINPDGSRQTNFGTGDITDVFSCIALLGQNGCGFEAQFGSVLAALNNPPPAGNEGFLRPDAYLAVVMLTNEDDCTVPPDSDLFNPNMTDPAKDTYGALQSYRCTEFGIKCDTDLPHLAPATPATLRNCTSKEDGRLMKVADFVNFLKASRPDPNKILFAAIAALQIQGTGTAATAVRDLTVSATTVGSAAAPVLNHVPGCESYSGDAALRIWDAVTALGGVFQSICQDSYSEAMRVIANTINKKLGPSCIDGKIVLDAASVPHCHVVDRTFSSDGKSYTDADLPACQVSNGATPCWKLDVGGKCPANSHQLTVDRGGANPPATVKAVADCEVCVPGSTATGCN